MKIRRIVQCHTAGTIGGWNMESLILNDMWKSVRTPNIKCFRTGQWPELQRWRVAKCQNYKSFNFSRSLLLLPSCLTQKRGNIAINPVSRSRRSGTSVNNLRHSYYREEESSMELDSSIHMVWVECQNLVV